MISWTYKEMAALALRGFAINEILRRHTVHYRCERVAKDSRDLHWLERFPRVLFSVGFFFGVACTVPVARDQYTALFWRASLERLSDCTIDNDGRDYCLIKSTLFSLSSLFFWKKNEVHIESQKGAGLYLIILLSRHLNGCALFFVIR